MLLADLPRALAHRGFRKGLVVSLVLPVGKHRAPAPLQVVASDLEEIGPFLWIGDVAARTATESSLEIEQRGEHQEPLGPGVALEIDVQALRTVLRPPSQPMT